MEIKTIINIENLIDKLSKEIKEEKYDYNKSLVENMSKTQLLQNLLTYQLEIKFKLALDKDLYHKYYHEVHKKKDI